MIYVAKDKATLEPKPPASIVSTYRRVSQTLKS